MSGNSDDMKLIEYIKTHKSFKKRCIVQNIPIKSAQMREDELFSFIDKIKERPMI